MSERPRKHCPVFSGVLAYFPDALMEVAYASFVGNEQHNPGEPLHWDRAKSTDDADALARHLLHAGELDEDGVRHSAKLCWRALAVLQKELEAAATRPQGNMGWVLDALGAVLDPALHRLEAAERSRTAREWWSTGASPGIPRTLDDEDDGA